MEASEVVALEGWKVELVSYQSAKPFVEKWHYSRNVNGLHISQCFGLFKPRPDFFDIPEMVGVAMYGKPAMNNQGQKWCPRDSSKLVELRRLCCVDDTPKNAESFFISKTLRWMRKNTEFEVAVAYADPEHGHDGTIYRASNWKLMGLTSPGVILMVDGERYHDRTLRMNKPYAKKIKSRVELGDGRVEFYQTAPKYIFLYRLQKAPNE